MRIAAVLGVLFWVVPLLAQTQTPVWEWDFPRIQALVEKVRAGRDLTPQKWPLGARVAVGLSFDFDAESGPLRSGNYSPQPLSRGEYGPRVGVPRILQMAEKHRVPLTFFIPAVDAQLHPDAIDAILQSPLKHEIGIHGWIHEPIANLKPGEERELTTRAFQWWTQRLGYPPAGIRTPSWDFTGDTLAIIRDLGLVYDSSLMADDRPYEIVSARTPTGLVELPVEWILDDYAYYSYDGRSNAFNRVGDSDVYEIYKGEFDQAYEEGTLFLLTMHPFVTGHRSRIAALDRLVTYMQSKPGVWFGTLGQVAAVAKAQLK
ncbi:MAG: polysaccharide deacetylase [Terriglobia bacterium]|jgi:peptidoglycan/xylan/chitin deacetylase (PgdA/CDA1 family)